LPDDRLPLLHRLLKEFPGSTARELGRLATREGVPLEKSGVNSVLHANQGRFFVEDHSDRPRWFVVDEPEGLPAVSDTLLEWAERLGACDWQKRALSAWSRHGHRGVVEAITGSGKTMLGVVAARWAVGEGRKALIIVPTLDLEQQWLERFDRPEFAEVRVRSLGGRHHDFASAEILVGTVQTVAIRPDIAVTGGLIVADECHRYGADAWTQALRPGFTYRLDLTATVERTDWGVEDHLMPYFGARCFSYLYGEALSDDVIARFRIGFLPVRFTLSEQEEYDRVNLQLNRHLGILLHQFGFPHEPFGELMREVARAAEGGDEATDAACQFLGAFTKRRDIMAESQDKRRRICALAEAIVKSKGTLIFTQTVDAATEIAEALADEAVMAVAIHGGMSLAERVAVLDAFRQGEIDAIVGPKLLDEGVDIPDAEMGIIVSASRSRLQMIQRMGRILRKKADGGRTTLIVFYIAGTAEDPSMGGAQTFVNVVEPHADELHYFGTAQSDSTICDWILADEL
jgi:superfamily II DNA or RNA helicase